MSILKRISLVVMVLFYCAGGLGHFFRPEMYMAMMPPYLPYPLALIYISGLAELGLGLAIISKKLRPWAAWGIIALLIAVFPANVYMLQTGGAGYSAPHWVLVARLPLQLVLILWAYWYTKPAISSPKSTP